jgi:phosphotransacetylase
MPGTAARTDTGAGAVEQGTAGIIPDPAMGKKGHPMTRGFETLADLIEAAKASAPPLRVAVVNAQQAVVIETLRDAASLGLVEPHLIGDPGMIAELASSAGYGAREWPVTEARSEAEAAAIGVRLVREGKADTLMKGSIHTDLLHCAPQPEALCCPLPG